MLHLEHVAELSVSYRDFLAELRRRRAYGQAVSSNSIAMMERLASMRSDEVKAREKFLRGPGRHLMPPFFEIFVPTLATPPPLFTPQMPASVELDTLPDIGPADVTDMIHGATDAGVSSASASSLTAESQQVQSEKVSASGGIEEVTASAQQQDQLIVSADTSGNDDVIMYSAPPDAENAELKTLAYENAVLRQALERMGGKAPKTYIDEAKQVSSHSEELAALRKELEQANTQTKAVQDALITVKNANPKESDKISHSSFEIGDVGLFMPTGRGSGNKRIYLAFHTNCPHRYLSTDNIKGNPDFVLGRIVYQEELVAGEVGTDANPYGLQIGTKFWVLTVEVLKSSPS
jgi:hypothetical protein